MSRRLNLVVATSTLMLSMVACAPLPTRDDESAFILRIHGTILPVDIPKFMDCAIDGFDRTENAIRWDIRTWQQRRSTGYRVERRYDLKTALLVVSADIEDSGDIKLFENAKLSSISPFVSTKQEIAAFNLCAEKFGIKK